MNGYIGSKLTVKAITPPTAEWGAQMGRAGRGVARVGVEG